MLTDDQVQALQNKYPGVTLDVIENENVAPGVSFVVRRPTDLEWQRYRTMQANEEQLPQANRFLVLGQIVQPSPQDFIGMLGSKPGLVETIAIKIREAVGVSNASTLRKL